MGFMNEATWDRVARVVVGLGLLGLGFGVLGGAVGTVVGIVGLVPLLTGAVGYCPLYALLHFRTNRDDVGAGGTSTR